MIELKVLNNSGELEDFDSSRIRNKIKEETGLDKEEVNKITNSVMNSIKKTFKKEISTSTIRSLINAQLVKRGLLDEEIMSRKIGMSVAEYEDLMENGCKDNANMIYTPEIVAKYSFDAVAKEYELATMPKEFSQAHSNGYLHIHDLETFSLKPNCLNHDIRFYARNGLMIDGKGEMGSVANPSKSLKVLLNHMLQALMAGSQCLSGGQAFSHFNVFLAPYCKGLPYKEVKQEIQGWIFNLNMSCISRGSQTIFSSINVEFDIPDFLKDVPAISFGGVVDGVYGDYQQEADYIFQAVCEVLKEKDAINRYHTFPNTIFVIREHSLDEYDWKVKMVHELLSENPTIYFMNCVNENSIVMGALTIDTPVMTEKGFRYPNELSVGDKVMTYSKEDGSKSWNEIYNIIEKEAPNKVFKITCENGYSFKVTENHKLPTGEGIVKSEDLKVGMELYNYIDEPFEMEEDLEKEFIGIFLADGFIRHKPKHQRNGNNIEFHLSKQWKKEYLEQLCLKLNYDFEVKIRNNNTYNFIVKELNLRNELVRLYDDNLNVKRFPQQCWNNKNDVANILKGLMFDAHKGSKNRWVWSCSDKELVYDVCFAISYLGMESTIYKDIRKGGTGNWKTNYRISFGRTFAPNLNSRIKTIDLIENNEPVYDLSIKNNANYVCGLGGIHSENCRTRLSDNYTGDWEKDLLNVGNFHYCTVNLPLIALESKDLEEFYKKLKYYIDISREILLYRKAKVEETFDRGMSGFLLQKDKVTGEPLYDINLCSFSIGMCGLNECVMALTGKELDEEAEFGEEIIKFMSDTVLSYKAKDGLRWSLFFTPAESTAHRFATIIKKKYPDAFVQGDEGNYYLTNSSHIPVNNSEASIIDHIKNADRFHKYAGAGNIAHIWLGEAFPNSEALYSFNKKIAKTNVKFWAYTNNYTYCKKCGYCIQLAYDKCPICDSEDVVIMSRITGYYQPVFCYNAGKKEEWKERYLHKVDE